MHTVDIDMPVQYHSLPMDETAERKYEARLRGQAVKFMHGDIHFRYRLENIRELAGEEIQNLLAGIEQKDIDELESLFVNTIYPDVDARRERDKSFESMIAVLKAPARLAHLLPSMPVIIFKYATIWPTALNVGLNAMFAYLLSVRLENRLMEEIFNILDERGTAPQNDFVLDEEIYREAYMNVPYPESRKMISHAMRVMNSGKNPRIIKAAYNIMCDVQNAFINADKGRVAAGQPPSYSDAVSALNFGKETLKKIEYTFGLFPTEKMARLVKIASAVESNYLDIIHGKK